VQHAQPDVSSVSNAGQDNDSRRQPIPLPDKLVHHRKNSWLWRVRLQPTCHIGHRVVDRLRVARTRDEREQQFALRVQTIRMPMITDLRLVVACQDVPSLLTRIRPLLVKLQGLRAQVAHQLIVQSRTQLPTNAQEPTDHLFGYPNQAAVAFNPQPLSRCSIMATALASRILALNKAVPLRSENSRPQS
jgi:hypothetical protein